MRKILHVDMDAFYASVEQRDDPKLKGKPIVVGGSPEGRGVVAAASYESRKFGIRSAMSAAQAKRLCPHLIFVTPNFKKYKAVSEQIREIFHEVTDLVEPLSLDEAYLDVTINKRGEPLARKLAEWIKSEIKKRTALTASAGVAYNKFLAKIASDVRKPDGLFVISPERAEAFLKDLPVGRIWGVGPVTEKKLHELGYRTAGDIRSVPVESIEKQLGSYGRMLHSLSLGIDEREVETEWDPKSSGAEETFSRDILDTQILRATLEAQAEEIAHSLKKMDCLTRTVQIKVRYKDFKTITRARTLFRPTDKTEIIAQTAIELMETKSDAGRVPVRLIGVSAQGLLRRDDPMQLWFELGIY